MGSISQSVCSKNSSKGHLLGVDLCSQNRYIEVLTPRAVNVTLFGNWVFADVTKVLGGHTGRSEVSPYPIRCPYKKRRETWGRHKVRPETEIGAMRLQAKDCQQPAEAGRKAWNRSSPRASGRAQPCWHLDFGPPGSRTARENFLLFTAPWIVIPGCSRHRKSYKVCGEISF